MNWNIINGIAAIDTINLVSSTLIKFQTCFWLLAHHQHYADKAHWGVRTSSQKIPKSQSQSQKIPKNPKNFGMNWDHPRNSGIFWDGLGSSQKKFIPKHPKFFSSFGIFWDGLGFAWDRPKKLGSSQNNWDHPKIIREILGTFGVVRDPCDHCIFAFWTGQFSLEWPCDFAQSRKLKWIDFKGDGAWSPVTIRDSEWGQALMTRKDILFWYWLSPSCNGRE